jgi:dihydrofolate synthase/folylpolyglutamate synthase
LNREASRAATPAELLEWLFSVQRFGIRPGLERVHALLAAAGNPQQRFRTVLVAGTNGKGSTASILASMLSAAGTRTGLFTSPHLSQVMERFRVDSEPLGKGALARVLRDLRPQAEEIGATFFEILVVAACRLFADASVETAVFEVGLGGRYDATNALEPVLSVITGVALDHVEVLGDSVGQIALDKAGIFRSGVPAVTGATGTALAVLESEAARLSVPLQRLDHEVRFTAAARGWAGSTVTVQLPGGAVLSVATGLAGSFQARNTALAVAAGALLGVPAPALRTGAAAAKWPGRLERLRWHDRWVVLDGAHNPSGAAALRAALHELGARPALLLAGVTADKDVAGVVSELAELAPRVITTRAGLSARALEADSLAAGFRAAGAGQVSTADGPGQALGLALELTDRNDTIVVAGSLYLIGEVRPLLEGGEAERFERWQ